MSRPDPRPVRRIVAGNTPRGEATIFEDRTATAVVTDPARPGYASTRVWVTETTPAPVAGVRDTLDLPHHLDPPPTGSVARFVTVPPDAWHIDTLSEEQAADFFASVGAASAQVAGATHPYMQRTASLDYVFVLSGEVTLVLDTEEVQLREGDTVVQLGAAHAWSNRSQAPCELFISSHGGTP